MKPSLVRLTLTLSCSLMALPALAQNSVLATGSTATAPAKTPVPAPKVLAAANGKTARPVAMTVVAAAGSVIILADGIVANSTIAQIEPPAPGFVYER